MKVVILTDIIGSSLTCTYSYEVDVDDYILQSLHTGG